ncbi:hypothetical protein G4B88_026545 [Cannabis sativa]|uniref:Uncharacterized protein n=1 Tax=Cannabis sativa TaxID=3483 RepID=A0A7J6GQT1_CANSA|nr:hypothetical protein G4B88_026545 [Cannabis sativa]
MKQRLKATKQLEQTLEYDWYLKVVQDAEQSPLLYMHVSMGMISVQSYPILNTERVIEVLTFGGDPPHSSIVNPIADIRTPNHVLEARHTNGKNGIAETMNRAAEKAAGSIVASAPLTTIMSLAACSN